MANVFNNAKDAPGIIAKAAAQMFADKVQFVKSIDKADESDYDGKNGYSAGDTIQISKPARFAPQTTADITSSIQDVTEEKVGLTLDVRSVVPIEISSFEFATDIQLKSTIKRIIEPAVSAIAQDVESRFLQLAVDATFNSVGTAGSTVFNTLTMLQANQRINEFVNPDMGNRYALLNPAATTSAVNDRKGLFQSSDRIKEQYEEGYMGYADGFTYLQNNLLPTHTNGNDVTGVAVKGGSQTGAALITDGYTTTTGTVTKGQIFTIVGVFAVHPITKATQAFLQQFVITADGTADGSGDITLAISPSIITTGSTQTVSAGPADDAAMVFVGAASSALVQNLAYGRDAFRCVSVPLIKPDGVDLVAQETVDGITIRIIRDYDVLLDRIVTRLDFLGGIAAVRPEWAVRITE